MGLTPKKLKEQGKIMQDQMEFMEMLKSNQPMKIKRKRAKQMKNDNQKLPESLKILMEQNGMGKQFLNLETDALLI